MLFDIEKQKGKKTALKMNFKNRNPNQKNQDLRIVGAISIDLSHLNGISTGTTNKERNDKNRCQVAIAILKEFCSNSTVHGIRYFTEPKRHWIERLTFSIFFYFTIKSRSFKAIGNCCLLVY
ncbi:uncharacterized protein LOC116348514 [Contarinia nasturtii]|uniref:uncharacterized protein LOC116348514 n=1 Tax=Contarinia nasturtii TaxID=265458 RepID=UPI0012D388C7|nr:uncharacterized protein LOC116348514 [Contarinia nasturtii]